MQEPVTALPAWRKVLWVRQPYADNYVSPEQFLVEMRKNVEVHMYRLGWLVRSTTLSITAHLASTINFVAFFYQLYREQISVSALLLASTTITTLLYLAWIARIWLMREPEDSLAANATDEASVGWGSGKYRGRPPGSHLEGRKMASRQAGKSAILFMMVLLGLTPILKTLTEDTSSDSIWILACLALLLNALAFDYGCEGIRGQDSLSLNAAIFASVLLASRLPSKAHVFGLMSMAIIWFALVPLLLRYLRQHVPWAHGLLVSLLIGGAGVLLAPIGGLCVLLYVALLLTISVLCPALFVYLQRYKNQIHGPWDEAVVSSVPRAS